MDAHFGGYHADQRGAGKRTDLQGPLGDQWVPFGNVFGNMFDGARSDQSRYNEGMYRTNELPFEQERVQHYGLDVCDIDHEFSVADFVSLFDLYISLFHLEIYFLS